MKNLTFEKNYTRDTSILIQQIWAQQLSRGIAKNKSWHNPFLPIIVHYIIDGTIEIWDNQQAVNWLKEKLLEQNLNDPENLRVSLNEYKEQCLKIKKYWTNGPAKTEKEFKEYLSLLPGLMYNFNLWYYSVTNEKTPKNLIEEILDIRKNDTFFASNDIYIISSLKNIHPEILGYESVLLLEEVGFPPHKNILAVRMKGATLIDGENLFLGNHSEFSKAYPQYILKSEEFEKGMNFVKGQVVFKGFAKGKVKILRRRDQVHTIEKGDVIVSPMTTPDFLPAMEKAAAFVTDEGGITCHAAIVAREMQKPCIIGTKIATKVLKDGDLVEVDADKGIVTIIKKVK